MPEQNISNIPARDIVRVVPPEVEIKPEGTIRRIIAHQITDDYDSMPFGLVATFPAGVVANAAQEVGDIPHGVDVSNLNVVMGIIGVNHVYHEVITNHQPWYKRSVEKQVKRAEKRAAKMVLGHLGLE